MLSNFGGCCKFIFAIVAREQSAMKKLIIQLELILDKLDAVDEQISALHLDSCIAILCENYKIKRHRIHFDPINIESEGPLAPPKSSPSTRTTAKI